MSLVRRFGYHLHVDTLHVVLYFILQQWTFNNIFKSYAQTFDLSCVSAETINLFLSASVDQEFSAQHSALGQSIRDEQANNKIY